MRPLYGRIFLTADSFFSRTFWISLLWVNIINGHIFLYVDMYYCKAYLEIEGLPPGCKGAVDFKEFAIRKRGRLGKYWVTEETGLLQCL